MEEAETPLSVQVDNGNGACSYVKRIEAGHLLYIYIRNRSSWPRAFEGSRGTVVFVQPL